MRADAGNLESDEARANDDEVLVRKELRMQVDAVLERSKHRRAGKRRKGSRLHSGGDNQFVEREVLTSTQVDRVALDRHSDRTRIEQDLGLNLVHSRDGDQQGAVAIPVAGQDLLGQRWAVVGRHRFSADKRNCAVVAEPSEGLRGRPAGGGGPDDDHTTSHGAPIVCATSVFNYVQYRATCGLGISFRSNYEERGSCGSHRRSSAGSAAMSKPISSSLSCLRCSLSQTSRDLRMNSRSLRPAAVSLIRVTRPS